MDADDRLTETDEDLGHDTGSLESTDIDADEDLDGEVDADGAGAIGERND